MADDIVERLRKFECRCEVLDDEYRCEACQAATEIERLRAEVVRLDGLLIRQNAVISDDIVTRLRAADDCLRYCECAECGNHFGRKCSCPCHDHPWSDAADEIERLRAELWKVCQRCRMGCHEEHGVVCDDCKEARRG